MKESPWMFSCIFAMSQSDCGKYEKDESARGAEKYGGCPSCVYREAYNAETLKAENTFANIAPESA